MGLEKTIFVSGFKHVGKTTLGQLLAKKLNLQFLDLDAILENTFKMSIRDIYQRQGLSIFRQNELECLQKLETSKAQVVSLGGGTLDYPESCEFIKNSAAVFVLEAPFEILYKRIMEKSPSFALLSPDDPRKSLEDLFEKRSTIFKNCGFKTFDATSTCCVNEMEDYVRKHVWKNF